MDDEGRTYHIGTKRGQVANRILSVGSSQRAKLLSRYLLPSKDGEPLFECLSPRGFLTITGTYHGVPVSIVSTQMGMANMDFVVRENRAVVDGPVAIIRLGTAGALQPPAHLGSLMVASQGSVCIRRDPDAFIDTTEQLPYTVSRPALADAELTSLLVEESVGQVGRDGVALGLNATADSFYSSQGRLGRDFDDRNDKLLEQLLTTYPDVISMEMETFQLLDLARISRGTIRAAALTIALAERASNRMMTAQQLKEAEAAAGKAALSALIKLQLDCRAPAAVVMGLSSTPMHLLEPATSLAVRDSSLVRVVGGEHSAVTGSDQQPDSAHHLEAGFGQAGRLHALSGLNNAVPYHTAGSNHTMPAHGQDATTIPDLCVSTSESISDASVHHAENGGHAVAIPSGNRKTPQDRTAASPPGVLQKPVQRHRAKVHAASKVPGSRQ